MAQPSLARRSYTDDEDDWDDDEEVS